MEFSQFSPLFTEYNDRLLLLRFFYRFVLPFLEFCSTMWYTAEDSHLIKLLERVVRSASFLPECVQECNLAHRRSIAVLCIPFKIKSNPIKASSVWCIAFAECAGACYSWCFGSLLLAAELNSQDLCGPIDISIERS